MRGKEWRDCSGATPFTGRMAIAAVADLARDRDLVPGVRSVRIEERADTERVPAPPLILIDAALNELARSVTLRELPVATSHTAIVAQGLESPRVAQALGLYLVGALAGAVDLDARLCSALLAAGPEARVELASTVDRLVGDSNVFAEPSGIRFRDTRRNAWIAEGVVHALLVLRARADTACLVGAVHALTQPHQVPTQQGLDAVAIYTDECGPVVAVGESKASRADGSGQLTDAATMFAAVDEGDYGPHLRAALLSLRRVLPAALAPQVSDALWREHRCYLPVILHETPFDPEAERQVLARLVPPIERRRLLALRLNDFHSFFDAVADSMRAAVAQVAI